MAQSSLGYFESKIELDHRFRAEQPERFRTLTQEPVESKVNIIVAVTGFRREMTTRSGPSQSVDGLPIHNLLEGPAGPF
jgi:hypothetical protein